MDFLFDIPERFPESNFSLVDLRNKYNRVNARSLRVRELTFINNANYIKIEKIQEHDDTTDLRIVVDVNSVLAEKLKTLRRSISTTLPSTILLATVVQKIVTPRRRSDNISTTNVKVTEILLLLNNNISNTEPSSLGLVEFIKSLVDDLQITINNVKMIVNYPPSGIDADVCQLLFGYDPSESYLKIGRKSIDLDFKNVRSSDRRLINEYLQSVQSS